MRKAQVMVAGVPLSSPGRVVYPEDGVTKLDVARYYEAVADRMLPAVAGRPVSLVRLPEGLGHERFYQKHPARGFPKAIRRVAVQETGGTADYMSVESAVGLVGAVQMGTVEFHVWGARRDRLDRPERLVLDLDPDDTLAFAEVRSAARDVRDRLADLGLASWPLVTGGKGVHVVVRLRRTAGWETVTAFARDFANWLSRDEPQRFVAEMAKARRVGRIFIDWLRNDRGATAIAPFSLRARAGAPVATPVTWDELERLGSAAALGMAAARERDWPALPDPQRLSRAVRDRLAEAARRARA